MRARLQALLQAHEQDGGVLKAPSSVAAACAVGDATGAVGDAAGAAIIDGPGSLIGPYKLLEQIGEGGFGVVFMAEQQRPVRRKVALKVLKPGMDTRSVVARFEAERQALALMEHQNIARVLDAGETASGRPYFVMELVRGIPITTFCDENHLCVRDRLRLFLNVGQAVQHAHQKGIIHRDLKPSNILVTLHDGTPVPKVIDFGIAKAMGQQLTDKTLFTGFAQMIGTPSYMSPEQAEMSGLDVDTRSDIYALGILLYELLTGAPPCDQERVQTAAFDEIRRIIREEEPARPSTRISTMGKLASTVSANRCSNPNRLSQLYQGELDWIVMKALEKDRNRRYETASALAADVERYLNNEPVLACPPSTWYRLRKTVRRHRGAVVAASLILVALVAGMIAATWGLIRAMDAETVALREARQKENALKEREIALTAAQKSEREAQEQLFLSLLNQARAGRFSRQMGQRLNSLDALAKAARLRPDERLRDEAIAAMALPDVRPGPGWRALPAGSQRWAFDDRYRLYARAGDDGVINIRTVPDDREMQSIRCPPTKTDLLRFSPDGRYLARMDSGRKVRMWRVSDGEEVLPELPARISGLAFSLNSRQLVVDHEGWILRFDVATGKELNRWQLPEKARAWGLAFHPDNRRLAIAYDDASIVSVYDSKKGELLANLPVGAGRQQAVAWHPDGTRLAVAQSQFIQIWDVDAKCQLATLEGHVQQVISLTFHPQGTLLASQSWDGVLRLWDPMTGRQLMQLPLLVHLHFSSDGRWLGVAERGEEAHLLEVTTTDEYRTLENKLGAWRGGNADGDISPDGTLLAVNMGTDGVYVWDLASGRQVADLPAGIPVFAR
ncbi:MAG TPA: WD40 repeat domain-containing serine/threonine protein kinase, partial [Gemmataceae bacterium]|nr:WD40 repeat domain-containing serine/threonine protein kinase [Gemmataceae bacterium]